MNSFTTARLSWLSRVLIMISLFWEVEWVVRILRSVCQLKIYVKTFSWVEIYALEGNYLYSKLFPVIGVTVNFKCYQCSRVALPGLGGNSP